MGKEAVRVHEKTHLLLGQLSTMARNIMLSPDSASSSKLEKKAITERHQPGASAESVPTIEPRRYCASAESVPTVEPPGYCASAEIVPTIEPRRYCASAESVPTIRPRRYCASAESVPTIEPRRYCAAYALAHVNTESCYKGMPSRSTAGFHDIVEMNGFGGTSSRNGDCNDATRTVGGIKHRSRSLPLEEFPLMVHTDPIRNNATKTVCGVEHRSRSSSLSTSLESPLITHRSTAPIGNNARKMVRR